MFIGEKKRYKRMALLLENSLDRILTHQEERHISWLCSWDIETFDTFMDIFKELDNKEKKFNWKKG